MGRLRQLAFLGGLLLSLTGPATADDEYDRCINASDGTNTAWSTCGSELLKREDDKLNTTWKRVYEGLPVQTKADLLEEQRAWNAFKEKSCLFYANGDWGREGQVLHFPNCRASLIAERTATLEAYGAFFKPN
jgi:uncharacterized protein YecT (DUF1311 family)